LKNIAKFISNERIAGYALLIVLVFAGTIRYSLLNVPFERDEGEYAYAGQLILQGIPPYQGVYNMKFPGIYAAYALFLAMFGQFHQSIHTALLIINAITIITIFLLAKHIANPLCAVVAAASFALLSVSQSVQGVFANAEHFVILFATGGLLVMLRDLATESLLRLFAAGLLLGLGFTMKQHGFAFVVLAGICDKDILLKGDVKNPESILSHEYEQQYRVVRWKQSHYRTVNQDMNIKFVPLYEIADEPYTIYFPVHK
jgi:hypothetical protein